MSWWKARNRRKLGNAEPQSKGRETLPRRPVTDPNGQNAPRRGLLGAVTVFILLALTSCAQDARLDTWKPKGRAAREIQDLNVVVFGIAGIVFVLVNLAVIFLILRFRRRKGDDEFPPQVHGNTKLELGWTIVPAL